jgi:hypothetical protein
VNRGEQVTVLTAPLVTDEYGTPSAARDWDNAVPTVVENCVIAPRSSSEVDEPGRTAVIVGLTVYLPAGATVTAHDRLLVRDDTYEVDGEPGRWRSPATGRTAGIEVALRRVSA